MNQATLGGASRPRRRRVLQVGGSLLAAAILLVAIRETNALVSVNLWDKPDQQFAQPDTLYARQLLAAVAGANGILCGAVDRSFDTGYSSHSLTSVIETDFSDQNSADVSRWIGKRRFDAAILPLARAALGSSDACVRRIGARLVGGIRMAGLHERVQPELTQPNRLRVPQRCLRSDSPMMRAPFPRSGSVCRTAIATCGWPRSGHWAVSET